LNGPLERQERYLTDEAIMKKGMKSIIYACIFIGVTFVPVGG
jgi:hypothetical protein